MFFDDFVTYQTFQKVALHLVEATKEDFVFVAEVAVRRHRAAADFNRNGPHGDSVVAVVCEQGGRGIDHAGTEGCELAFAEARPRHGRCFTM